MVFKINLAHKTNYGSKRNLKDIKFIVIHYTGNDGDTDENNANYFKRPNLKVSAQYFVDDDSYTQSVPDDYVAYSVGGSKWNNSGGRLYGKVNNSNSINIELCDTKKDGTIKATQQTINNAIELTKILMQKYNIPISNVIRHYDVNGKTCPAFWLDDEIWEREFLSKLIEFRPIYNGLDFSPVFNANYYKEKNEDVAKSGFGVSDKLLFEHFIKYGIKECRQASANFNINVYSKENKDLNILLIEHYLKMGKNEPRKVI